MIPDWLHLCKRDFWHVTHPDDGHCPTNVDHPFTMSQNIWCACTFFTFTRKAEEYTMALSQQQDGAVDENPANVSTLVAEHSFEPSLSTTGMGQMDLICGNLI
jgi:hypothetical protein